jgi:hypothetical protein
MGQVRVEIAGKPLRCSHCEGDVFRYDEITFEVGRSGGFFANTYLCSGCGGVHLFAGAEQRRHLRTEVAAEVDPIKCLACGVRLPAEAQRCPACGWTWAVAETGTPIGGSR